MSSSAELSRFRTWNLQRFPVKRALALVMAFSGWTILFAVIYAQSPLFTSNQNQYFLHGLANAKYGFLENDWLANTQDPTPIFSLLVSLTHSFFHTSLLYYLYYAILLGIYLYSLLGIGSHLYDLRHPNARLVYLTLLLVIHSAGMRFFLSRALGPDWTYLLEGGLAGQRILGVVFQPSSFGVLLVLSLYLFLIRRFFFSILPLALAVIFHPTYLLSAGIITLAYIVASYQEERNLRVSLSIGVLAFLLVSLVIFYVFTSFGFLPTEITSHARDILVYTRIPHHAVIEEWFDLSSIFQIAFIVIAIYLLRSTHLFPVIGLSFLIATLLTIVQAVTKDKALALLFPWRISSILVPFSVAVVSAVLLREISDRLSFFMDRRPSIVLLACRFVIVILTLIGATRMVLERRMVQSGPERELLTYVNEEKEPGDVYLIPIKMQDFRLGTGAPIYVDFKSIPYRDDEVLEWNRRIKLATQFYDQTERNCTLVDQFTAEGVTHIVIDLSSSESPCRSMRLKYLDEHYGVYSITR